MSIEHHISGPQYWRSLEQLAESPAVLAQIEAEFPHYSPDEIRGMSRRKFMKLMAASMALAGVEKLAEAIDRARYVAAIEWVIAAQAVDLRATPLEAMGRGAAALQRRLRAQVPMLDGDRPLGPDFEHACTLLRDGAGAGT